MPVGRGPAIYQPHLKPLQVDRQFIRHNGRDGSKPPVRVGPDVWDVNISIVVRFIAEPRTKRHLTARCWNVPSRIAHAVSGD